jgi:hypothetical protein
MDTPARLAALEATAARQEAELRDVLGRIRDVLGTLEPEPRVQRPDLRLVGSREQRERGDDA